MMLRRMILAAAVALAAVLGPAATPAPANEVQNKMTSFAKQIAALLKQGNHSDAAVGEITGPPEPASASGPGLQKSLIAELEKLSVSNKPNAFFIIKGEYQPIEEDGKKDELIVRLTITIKDKKGRKYDDLTADLNHKANDDIVKLLGLNADMNKQVKATPEDRNQELKKIVEKPQVYVDNTKVQNKPESPFAVEILVKGYDEQNFKVAPPKITGGNTFVELKKGDEYIIRLHNNSKHEAAAFITIDGVDAFSFFDTKLGKPSTFLVQPGKPREVKGWHRDFSKLNAFLVGSYSDSAAAKVLKNPGKLGTINVCFHPCWEVGKTPPEYDGSRSAEPNGTGLGREQEAKTKNVKRTIGPLLNSVTIRYNNQ